MQLTKGAIGNLINRYKAVLKKCHLMNVFGSLAVAAMLVMGGAGGAAAAEFTPPGDWWESPENIILTAGEEWTLDSERHENVQTKFIIIHAGASMILKNGSRLSGSSRMGNYGTLTLDNSTLDVKVMYNDVVTGYGILNMSGTATLTLTDEIYGTAIEVGTLAVTDGPATLTVSGGTEYGRIDVGTLSVRDGTATLTAKSTRGNSKIEIDSLTVTDGMVTLMATSNNLAGEIDVGTLTVVTDGMATLTASGSDQSYIDVGTLTVTDGTANLTAMSDIFDANIDVDTLTVASGGTATLEATGGNGDHGHGAAGSINITSLNVKSDGTATLEATGGYGYVGYGGYATITVNSLTVASGGTATLKATGGYGSSGGTITVGTLTVTDGTARLDLAASTSTTITTVTGDTSGASLTLAPIKSATLQTVLLSTVKDIALTLEKGITVRSASAEGVVLSGGMLDLSAATLDPSLVTSVKDGGTLQLADNQVDQLTANTGSISLVSTSNVSSTLDFGESATLDTATLNKITDSGCSVYKATDLTLTASSGAALDLPATSRIETGTLTLDNSGTGVTLASGEIRLAGANGASTAALTGATLTLNSNSGNSADAVLRLGDAADTSDDLGGTLGADISIGKGAVVVENGVWTLDAGESLNIGDGGALTIGGQGTNAALIVDTDAALLSATEGNGTTGINVLALGRLEADSDALFSLDENGNVTLVSGLHKLHVAKDGLLSINLSGDISLTADYNIRQSLVTGDGLIEYVGGTSSMGSREADFILASPTWAGGLYAGTTATATAENGEVSLIGGYGVDAVDIASDTPVDSVIIAHDLTLVGEGELLTATDSSGGAVAIEKVVVTDGTSLNLGYTGHTGKSGRLDSDIVLGTDKGTGSLVAYGEYTVDNILAVKDGAGTVSAQAGAQLTTGDIGAADKAVGEVIAGDGGVVTATGSIWTRTVNLNNGGTEAESITVTGPLDAAAMTGGTLLARSGDITLKENAAGISGRIEATAGSISAADIIGASGGSLDLVAGQTITAANITATSLSADQLTAKDVSLTGGELHLAAGDISGALLLDGVSGTGGDAKMGGGLTLRGGSEVAFDSLTPGGDVLVGTETDTTGSTLTVTETLALGGHVLAVDPAWDGPSSNVAVNTINDDPTAEDVMINGGVAVGQNAYAAIGTADQTWLPNLAGTLSQDGTTAALGIFRPLTIAAGYKLLVDGSRMGNALYNGMNGAYDAAAANSVTLAANSLLVVNGGSMGTGTAAISFAAGTGTLQVANGAKLLIADAVPGEQYTIVADADNLATAFNNTNYNDAAATGWKGNNLLAGGTTVMLVGRYDAATDTLVFTAKPRAAANVYSGLSSGMTAAVDALYAAHTAPDGTQWNHADVDSPHMGVRFLSRATDNRYIGGNASAAVRTIESAARMALAGAVPQMTKMAADAGVNAVVNRLGLANPANGMQTVNADGKVVDRNTTGFALWIAPLWQNMRGWGMEAGNLDYGFNGNLGGVSLGADYTFENAIRAGITFNIGGGYAESSGGDLSSTQNNMSFWGLGAYMGWNYQNFGLMADAGYTGTYNKLKQDLDAGMGMRDLRADVRAGAWQVGLRAEYRFETSALDIIPHVGVRYMSLTTWGYDVKSNGTVLEGDGMTQNIWTFPVGVTFSKDVALDNGWYFRPSVDVTVIPAAGDITARQDVRFTGLPGAYEVETRTMDYLTWQGGVGLELGNDNMSIGVNYTLQAGQNSTGHGLFGSFRYEF